MERGNINGKVGYNYVTVGSAKDVATLNFMYVCMGRGRVVITFASRLQISTKYLLYVIDLSQ